MVVQASTSLDDSFSEASTSTISAAASRHNDLWFPDGNIILATDTLLFRVHKSVLSMHSSVFRDMFELATIDDALSETGDASSTAIVGMSPELDVYDGVPLVSLPSDEGVDVEELLLAVHDRSFYNVDGKNGYPLDTILALLRLSTKYDFEGIRKEVITHISKYYPTGLLEFEALDGDDESLFMRKRRDVHLPLLKAAVTTGVDDLFPSLYYACAAHHTLPQILDAFAETPSGIFAPALRRLIEGREALGKAIHIVMGVYVEDTEHCLLRHKADDSGLSLSGVFVAQAFATHNLRAIAGRMLSMDWDLGDRICDVCIEPLEQHVDTERRKVWEEVPAFFGLEKWDRVRYRVDYDNNPIIGGHVRKSSRKLE